MGNGTIKNIMQPTLHVWGAKDLICPKFMMDENIKAIKHSKSIIYENCGHSLLVDEINFVDDVLQFILEN